MDLPWVRMITGFGTRKQISITMTIRSVKKSSDSGGVVKNYIHGGQFADELIMPIWVMAGKA